MNWKKYLPYLGILSIGIAAISFLALKRTADIEQMRSSFITEKRQETDLVAQRVEHSFRAFYQGLRTITQLPGVRNIDRYGKNFAEDSKLAVQQIYNNTYENVTLSEVYILPKSLNPENIDPKTGNPESPIITFDEFIVGGAAKSEEDSSDAAPKEEELEEVEIFEYRLMNKQLQYLASTYPTQSSVKGFDIPAVSGEPVVTCDNSEFTKSDLDAGNDKPRKGFVYTLPVYNQSGAFHAAVSGVVRVNVIEKLLPEGTHGIVNPSVNYEGVVNPIAEYKSASKTLTRGEHDTDLIYNESRKLNIVDTTEWRLIAVSSNANFYDQTAVKQANLIFYSGTLVVLVLAIALMLAVRTSQAYASSLESKVNEKTAELSSRNQAMKLVFDNSKEGFVTCSLDGTMGAEYSKILVDWFGEPMKDQNIANYLFPHDKKRAAIFQMNWTQLVEDVMPFTVTAENMAANFQRGNRWFSAALTEIRDDSGTLKNIMIVISDTTSRVLAEENARAQQEAMAVFHSVQNDRVGFIEFFEDAENLIKLITSSGSNQNSKQLSKDEEFRLIHTLKGNCGQYGIISMAEVCHTLETSLQDGDDPLNHFQKEDLRTTWQSLCGRLINVIGSNKNSTIELDEEEYAAILNDIRSGASHQDIAASVERWRLMPVKKRLERIGEQAKTLAERVGVEDIEVKVETENLCIHPEQFKNFWTNMTHVIRNALDHGLKGVKNRKPTLTLAASSAGNNVLVVTVTDNGKGIDWDAVRNRAKKMGLRAETQADLEMCLFADGLSTADSVSSISGRGVGMAAVKESINESHGSIFIKSEAGGGTTFEFRMPLSSHVETFKISKTEKKKAPSIVTKDQFSVSVSGRKILVVDDDPSMLGLLSEMLQSFGCLVITASNVSDAIHHIVSTQDIDVVITDSRMGEERGLEIISYCLNQSDVCQNLIVCSGYLEYLNFDERVRTLAKPFSEEELMQVLKSSLSGATKLAA